MKTKNWITGAVNYSRKWERQKQQQQQQQKKKQNRKENVGMGVYLWFPCISVLIYVPADNLNASFWLDLKEWELS